MNDLDVIEPITVLKSHAAELIRKARETGHPIVITQNGKATAVLQDAESFQRQRHALLLLRYLVKGEEDYREGDVLSDADADRHFRTRLESLKRGD